MKIEEGKFYRDANGVKQGPLHKYDDSDDYGWSVPDLISVWWSKDGKAQPGKNCVNLISEWTDGPVRTITRQEIIPGTYDGVKVGERKGNFVSVEFQILLADADQLERAAAVLTALADALKASEAPR